MEKKCVLVYASISGNTKRMAESIADGLIQSGCEPDIKEMYATDASDLDNYDCILLGSSTWGGGDLPDEALDFYEEMSQLKLYGKFAAVFGSGDRSYKDHFATAVDLLECKLRELGARIVLDPLKLNLSPSVEELEACRDFGKKFSNRLFL